MSPVKKTFQGRVTSWEEAKGFGWIVSEGEKIFVHRREFTNLFREVAVDDRVSFVVGQDKRGRECATQVTLLNSGRALSGEAVILLFVLLVLPFIAFYRVYGVKTAGYLMTWYAFASIATYIFYALDKRSARNKGQREPENWLHLAELIGGWPGGFIAQRRLRHKSAKTSYQVAFWLIVAAHQLIALELFRGWPIIRNAFDQLSS